MNRYSRFISIIIALFVLIGSISLSGIAFAEDEFPLEDEEVIEVLLEEKESDDEDEIMDEETNKDFEDEDNDEDNLDDEEELSEEDMNNEEEVNDGTGLPEEGEEEELPNEENVEEEQDLPDEELGLEGMENEEALFEVQGQGPNNGKITVHKRIQWPNGNINADLGDGEYTIRLTGPNGYDEELVINKKGNTGDHVTFSGLAPGTYYITETKIEDDELEYDGYDIFDSDPNSNHGPVGHEVEVKGSSNNQRWILNYVKEKPKYGDVIIYKTVEGEELNDLSGFAFELHQKGKKVFGPEYTDESGKAVFSDVPLGLYKVVEVLTNEQKEIYEKPDNENVDVSKEGGEFVVNFVNKLKPKWSKGKISIIKISFGLPGRFGITPLESSKNITFTLEGDGINLEAKTNALGFASFDNLPEGEYILKEVVPEGYRSSLPEDGKVIVIRKHKLLPPIFVNNYKQPPEPEWEGTIIVNKLVLDEETQSYLDNRSGFEFKLYVVVDGVEELFAEGATPDDGILVFDGLPEGVYVLRETPREGYVSDLSNEPIYLDAENTPNREITIDVTNTIPRWTGEIRVNKLVFDEETQSYLDDRSGFEFILYRVVDGVEEFYAGGSTSEDGSLVFENLPEGEYVLREVEKEGYTSDNPVVVIELNSENEEMDNVIEVTVTNTLEFEEPEEEEEEEEEDDDDDIPVDDEDDEEDDDDDITEDEDDEEDDDDDIAEDEDDDEEVLGEDDDEEIIGEEIPEAQPEPEPEEEVLEEEVIEEEIPEAVPLATLPKTGSASSIIYSGLGTLLLGLGLFLNKRRK